LGNKNEEQKDGLKQVAIELLNRGMAVDQVAKFVDLPIKEIEELKK
jgi:hypothetical protein